MARRTARRSSGLLPLIDRSMANSASIRRTTSMAIGESGISFFPAALRCQIALNRIPPFALKVSPLLRDADAPEPPRRSWSGLRSWGGFGFHRGGVWVRSSSVLEAPALVACFDDIAMVCEPIEHGGSHLGVPDQQTMPPLLMVWSLKCALFLAAMGCLARCCPSSA
jgi:hypothetical protein